MVYNKDLFDEYQVSVPTTWDEFLNVCEVFKEAGIIPQAFGDLEAWAVCHYMTTFNTLCVPDDVRKADSDSETCTSVSYTHLDVYKRQLHDLRRIAAGRRLSE